MAKERFCEKPLRPLTPAARRFGRVGAGATLGRTCRVGLVQPAWLSLRPGTGRCAVTAFAPSALVAGAASTAGVGPALGRLGRTGQRGGTVAHQRRPRLSGRPAVPGKLHRGRPGPRLAGLVHGCRAAGLVGLGMEDTSPAWPAVTTQGVGSGTGLVRRALGQSTPGTLRCRAMAPIQPGPSARLCGGGRCAAPGATLERPGDAVHPPAQRRPYPVGPQRPAPTGWPGQCAQPAGHHGRGHPWCLPAPQSRGAAQPLRRRPDAAPEPVGCAGHEYPGLCPAQSPDHTRPVCNALRRLRQTGQRHAQRRGVVDPGRAQPGLPAGAVAPGGFYHPLPAKRWAAFHGQGPHHAPRRF